MITSGDINGSVPVWVAIIVLAYTISGVQALLSADKWTPRWWLSLLIYPAVIVGVCWLLVQFIT